MPDDLTPPKRRPRTTTAPVVHLTDLFGLIEKVSELGMRVLHLEDTFRQSDGQVRGLDAELQRLRGETNSRFDKVDRLLEATGARIADMHKSFEDIAPLLAYVRADQAEQEEHNGLTKRQREHVQAVVPLVSATLILGTFGLQDPSLRLPIQAHLVFLIGGVVVLMALIGYLVVDR